MIKVLSETKPKSKPKIEIKQKPELKIEIKPKPETEPEPKIEVKFNRKKLEKLKKDFDELRHKFSKTETNEYRKSFYDTKKYKHLSVSETKTSNKSLNELKKSLKFKKFCGNIDSVDYEDLDNYNCNYDFAYNVLMLPI